MEDPVIGTVTAQNSSSRTGNRWVAPAVIGTLAMIAAGDGRAHPTGKMGSFGLTADDVVLRVAEAQVPRADGVREPSVHPEVEATLSKPLAEYALA